MATVKFYFNSQLPKDLTVRIVRAEDGEKLGICGTVRDLVDKQIIFAVRGISIDKWLFIPIDSARGDIVADSREELKRLISEKF